MRRPCPLPGRPVPRPDAAHGLRTANRAGMQLPSPSRMDSFLPDLRTTIRSLRRSGVAYAAVATLAVGIGGLCAIFGVVDLTLLRPLPVAHEEQMLRLREGVRQPDGTVDAVNIVGPHFQEIAAQSRTLTAITAMSAHAVALTSGDV